MVESKERIKRKVINKLPVNCNVVEEYKLGNTVIKICDDAYRDKSDEEIEAVLKKCVELSYKYAYA